MVVDRTSKVAFAELPPQATKLAAAEFPRRGLAKLPYQVHAVRTDNGIQFSNMRLQTFLLAHNHAKRLRTFRGLTAHEFVCAQWQQSSVNFN